MSDATIFTRLAELERRYGADELLARLDQLDQAAEAQGAPFQTPRQRQGKKEKKQRADGGDWGTPFRHRRRGVEGWALRPTINGVRRLYWASTKKELNDEIAQAQKGNRRITKNGVEKQPPRNLNEARTRFLNGYTKADRSKRALEDRLKVMLDTPILELSGRTLGDLPFGEWDDEEIGLLVNQLQETPRPRTGEPYSDNSMRGHLKGLRQLGNWLSGRYAIQNYARLVDLPEFVKAVDPLADWDEVYALARAFDELCLPVYSKLTRFACGAGPRPEEWLVLRECDFNRKEQTVTFRRVYVPGLGEIETMKTEDAKATIYLPDIALQTLEEIPPSLHRDPRDWQRSPLLFPDHRTGGIIDLHRFREKAYPERRKPGGPWTLAFERAGLRRRPPKQMRHTFAVLALKAGVPIEDVALMLRHKDGDTEMVRKHYSDIVPKMARRSVEQLNLATRPFSLRTGQAL